VEMLKRSFATHSITVTIRTGNGPQLVSEEFEEFAREWNFSHTTSSPYYAQSNGKAESTVKITTSESEDSSSFAFDLKISKTRDLISAHL